jgi:hypothetical protein
MPDPLATYLHDHLAGSKFAIELLDSLHKQHGDSELGQFAHTLRAEVKADQDTLQRVVNNVGTSHLDLKVAAGWLGEKVSQLKLRGDASGPGIGTFEAFETLALGILGKLSLWLVLPVIAETEPRVGGLDYDRLAARAREQHARVEQHRLQIARATFKGARERDPASK